jgi:hypothetical protein
MIAVGVALMTYAWKNRSRNDSFVYVPPMQCPSLVVEAGPVIDFRVRPVVELFRDGSETGLTPARKPMPNPWEGVAEYFVSPRYLAPALQVRERPNIGWDRFGWGS